MPPVVLIPVNRFDRAKGRLADFLGAAQREQLAIATFRTVIQAVRDAGLVSVALTPDPAAVKALAIAGRVVAETPDRHGLNGQLEGVITTLGDEVLVLHADLPLATGQALKDFLQAAGDADAALVQSRDGGTNAMLLRPPGRFPLAYGPGSFAAHDAAARAAGLRVEHVESLALALDLDTPADIEQLLSMTRGRETVAGKLIQGFVPRPVWPYQSDRQ
jgi:2-phospho-L-lactate guanylyltransferase